MGILPGTSAAGYATQVLEGAATSGTVGPHHSPLAAAQEYLRAGLSILPVALDGSKGPNTSDLPLVFDEERGKYVPKWKSFQNRLPTEEDVQKWFSKNRPPGVGIINGKVSGNRETIDFDTRADEIFPRWRSLVEEGAPGLYPRLSVVKTPNGYHVSYRCETEVPGGQDLALPKEGTKPLIETKAEGGYVVAPGSPAACHPTGKTYEHFSGPKLSQIQIITKEERELLIRYAKAFDEKIKGEKTKPDPQAGNGQGQRVGDEFNQRGLDWAEILVGWTEVRPGIWRRPGKDIGVSATTGYCKNQAGNELFYVFTSSAPPFEKDQSYSKFSAYTFINHKGDFKAATKDLAAKGYGSQQTGQSNESPKAEETQFTDMGNGVRLVQSHGQDLRYCWPMKNWFIWDGKTWTRDEVGKIMLLAKNTIKGLCKWAKSQIDELAGAEGLEAKAALARINAVLAHAIKSQASPRLKAMVDLARSEETIPILADQMDINPWILNVANGIVDLRTGKLHPHSRKEYCTHIVPIAYDPDAKARRWAKFLDEIMDGDPEMVEFLARAVGYSITGVQDEQCLFFLHGSGCNGKSVFLATLQTLLGDYSCQGVSELLTVRKVEQHPTERADLFGRRFVALAETENGKRMAESLVKQLTGGDKIRARFMFNDFFEFSPTHHFWLSGNHKPRIVGTDTGIWRRLKLVPFEVSFEGRQDPHLVAALKAEAPGILAWAVRGCLEWREMGLSEPQPVRAAVEEYRIEQDGFGRWLDEFCTQNSEFRAKSADLYSSYKAWAESTGEYLMSKTPWGEEMIRKGFQRFTNNGTWYRGVMLKNT